MIEKRYSGLKNVKMLVNQSKPWFWKRYVDDVCAAIKSNLVLALQSHLNNIELSIQFTVERETERKISFLDVTVCRKSIANRHTQKDISRLTLTIRLFTKGLW